MKKLLLGALILLLSTSAFAQKTFVRKYTSVISVSNDVKGEWEDTDITVVFNANGVTDIVFYYPNGSTRTFHQVTSSEENKTTNGETYQIVECLDESGDRVAIQLFDSNTCLRIIIAKGYYVEFHKD
jgi:hypothetical protein